MPPPLTTTWSAVLGLGIGLLYAAGATATARIALHRKPRQFVLIILCGTLMRMVVALAVLAVLVSTVQLDIVALSGAFLLTFLVSLAAEILHMLRLKGHT